MTSSSRRYLVSTKFCAVILLSPFVEESFLHCAALYGWRNIVGTLLRAYRHQLGGVFIAKESPGAYLKCWIARFIFLDLD